MENITPQMQKLVTDTLAKGNCVMVGEWRGAKAEKINYTDKKTGQAKTFSKVRHTVEIGGEGNNFQSVDLDEMLPDGQDVEKYVPVFKRGDRVLAVLKDLSNDFGAISGGVTALIVIK